MEEIIIDEEGGGGTMAGIPGGEKNGMEIENMKLVRNDASLTNG